MILNLARGVGFLAVMRQLQEQFGGRAIGSIEEFAAEADQITIGWAIDQDGGKTYLDLSVTALPGTKLAKQIGLYADTASDYSGFLLEDAAATFHFTSPLAKAMTASARRAARLLTDWASFLSPCCCCLEAILACSLARKASIRDTLAMAAWAAAKTR